MGKYDDIINLPHHTSDHHPQMTLSARAAQFSPFAALDGFDEAVDETARSTDEKRELTGDEKERIGDALNMIAERLKENTGPETSADVARPGISADVAGAGISADVTYFIPDEKKSGGKYVSKKIRIILIDARKRVVAASDGTEISVDQITDISL